MLNTEGIHQTKNLQLLVVDVQQRLLPQLVEFELMMERIELVCNAAQQLAIPVTAVEQYPYGLGPLDTRLDPYIDSRFSKDSFSAFGAPEFFEQVAKTAALQRRNHLLLVGCEAHVCVLQTALHALQLDYMVTVVWDGVSSRHQMDKELAMHRLSKAGCQIVSAEMLVFELLGNRTHSKFKTLLPFIKNR